jgi:hypothetical protein
VGEDLNALCMEPRNPRSDEIPGDDARGEEERGIKRDRKRTRDRNRTRDDARGGRKRGMSYWIANPILQAVLTLAQDLKIGLAVTRHEDLGGRHGTRKIRVAGDVGEEPGPAHPSLIVTFVSRRRGG